MEYAKPAKSTICLNVSNVIGSSFEFCQNNRSAQSCKSVWDAIVSLSLNSPPNLSSDRTVGNHRGGQYQVSNCRIWKVTPGDRHFGVISALGVSGLHCLHFV